MTFTNILKKLESNIDLTKEDLLIIFHDLEEKKLNDKDIEKLVLLWEKKEEKPHELKNLVDIIFSKQKKIKLVEDAIDTCGTGGDKLKTFNISTITAIVASSLGLKVIKHGGKSTTSVLGSVDVLNSFGFDIDLPESLKEECFKKTNLMFVSSKILREVFGEVKAVCKKIGVPGFVNLLGPLTNPYKTKYHLLGVSRFEWGQLLASSLKLIEEGSNKEAFVVCSRLSNGGCLDELSLCGENFIWSLVNGKINFQTLNPQDLGFEISSVSDLMINNPKDGQDVFENILKGNLSDSDPKLLTIALNTGALLYLSKKAKSLKEGLELTLLHIKSGKVWEHFQNFLTCSIEKS